MKEFQTGFARVDITPPLGTTIAGYFHRRVSDGMLDPLLASAVAISDGEKLSVILSVDLLGIAQGLAAEIRAHIAERIGTEPEAVFVCCTHTHLGPDVNHSSPFNACEENDRYIPWLIQRLGDAAVLAASDLKKTEIVAAKGAVRGVSFVRCFRMKDGSVQTNPGWQNPNIDKPLFDADEGMSLVVFKRENAKEIALINFQVHPDVISGCKFSADYPKFVRDTYESVIGNTYCMFINGAQGDTNHIDVSLGADQLREGYKRAEYMGRAIACEAIRVYPLAEKISSGALRYVQKNIKVPYNTATPEEVAEAERIYQLWLEGRDDEICEQDGGMTRVTIIARACRIMKVKDKGDEKELYLTALSFGDVALACLPGEPFGGIGRAIKDASEFKATLVSCCANGYEGYFPMSLTYEGGYESSSAVYRIGIAERLAEEQTAILKQLKASV